MTLNPHPAYPSARCYVLKLHRDAAPQSGRLRGRLEHVASGESIDFDSNAALLDALIAHAARINAARPAGGASETVPFPGAPSATLDSP